METGYRENDFAVAIFSGTLWEAQIIQSLLHNAEIHTYLVNAMLSPYAYSPARASDVRIMISNYDIDKARIVIEEYFASRQSNDKMQ